MNNSDILGTLPVRRLIYKLVPPMMLVFLVQALYNITDSLFVAQYSESGLTALSIIYPMQLLILALSTGTGSGINVITARLLGEGNREEAEKTAFHGLVLGVINWAVFGTLFLLSLDWYFGISTDDISVISGGIEYGKIILIFSFGIFIESNCTKILQAVGDMKTPMYGQIAGAFFNILFDYILIFGKFGFGEMGIKGAAIATASGQILAMVIVLIGVLKSRDIRIKPCHIDVRCFWKIYYAGIPNIVMQSLYTVYIFGLNLILGMFSQDAVTVLGIYYKLQTFFFIPLFGMEQAILPIISYNYGMGSRERIKQTLVYSCTISAVFMIFGVLAFGFIPETLLGIFSKNSSIIEIGKIAYPIIGSSFIPAAITLLLPVYFQGLGKNFESIFMTVLRQVVLFVPVAYILSKAGLECVWYTFPVTEIITLCAGLIFAVRSIRK